MGKKAKVQIQKAKPEKETESEMFIPLLSVEGREKEAGNGRRVGSGEGHNMKQRSFGFP